jgi:hypothetical protein
LGDGVQGHFGEIAHPVEKEGKLGAASERGREEFALAR